MSAHCCVAVSPTVGKVPVPLARKIPENLIWAGKVLFPFSTESLIRQALTHSSASSATRPSYERLEFLGDAILGSVVATELFHRLPRASEGTLTRLRAQLVNERTLANKVIALGSSRIFGLGDLSQGLGVRSQSCRLWPMCLSLFWARSISRAVSTPQPR